jgi:hypothetical protein
MDAEDFRVDERDTIGRWVASFNEQACISRQITAGRDLDTPCAWPPLAHRLWSDLGVVAVPDGSVRGRQGRAEWDRGAVGSGFSYFWVGRTPLCRTYF